MNLRVKSILAQAAAISTLFVVPIPADDEIVVLRGETSQVSVAVGGGGIVEFRFLDQQTNPLNWDIGDLEPKPDGKPYLRGHFVCLDRWGTPSDAEKKHGMPFHGEAPRIVWEVVQPARRREGEFVTKMKCTLPMAGLQMQRTMRLDMKSPVLSVSETVTNRNKLGRVYNMVQHPSIAPPFLDGTTLVDSNARHGFSQSGSVPDSKTSASVWPDAIVGDRSVDLRRFRNSHADTTSHDVTSFVFDDLSKYGWVTACNPRQQLLIGYFWKTSEYPWLNVWRYLQNGKVAARGLEFGTTGYHQPFPKLVETGRILDRRLFDYLDADQTITRTYAAFLLKIPKDYQGVSQVEYKAGRLTVSERRDRNPRQLVVEAGRLFTD